LASSSDGEPFTRPLAASDAAGPTPNCRSPITPASTERLADPEAAARGRYRIDRPA
jgi:hypothetical protein